MVIRRDIALIAHLPAQAIVDGEPVRWDLYPVDLEAGRTAALLALEAKKWQYAQDVIAQALDPSKLDVVGSALPADPFDGLNGEAPTVVEPPARSELPDRLADLRFRAAELKAAHPESVAWVRARWPADCPSLLTGGPWTPGRLEAIDRILIAAEAEFVMPFDPAPAQRPASRRLLPSSAPRGWVRPDDGDEVTELTEAAMRRLMDFGLVPAMRARVLGWMKESNEAGRPIRCPDGKRRVRTAEILRAMVAVAHHDDGDDELARHLLAATLDTEAALQPTVSLGMCFGSLTIDEANRLAEGCAILDGGASVLAWAADGRPFLQSTTNPQTKDQ